LTGTKADLRIGHRLSAWMGGQLPRQSLVTTLLISFLLVACGSDSGTESTAESDQDASTPADTPEVDDPETKSPLMGTWRTKAMSPSDLQSTLQEHDLDKWSKHFAKLSPITDSGTVLILDVGEDWDLYGKTKGQPRYEIDYNAAYSVNGNKVVVRHSEGTNTHRWSIKGDTLTLEWVKTTLPGVNGIPEEVFQRALYMTQEFEKRN
jgi:hypothetical protein